jgi:hypothetical protein
VAERKLKEQMENAFTMAPCHTCDKDHPRAARSASGAQKNERVENGRTSKKLSISKARISKEILFYLLFIQWIIRLYRHDHQPHSPYSAVAFSPHRGRMAAVEMDEAKKSYKANKDRGEAPLSLFAIHYYFPINI